MNSYYIVRPTRCRVYHIRDETGETLCGRYNLPGTGDGPVLGDEYGYEYCKHCKRRFDRLTKETQVKADLTDITLLIDRSGSMSSCNEKMDAGIADFIKAQASDPGQTNLTIVQFDDKYETVYSGPIADAPVYKLMPRNSTALIYSLGRVIHETGIRLAAMRDEDRPSLVVIQTVTDGLDNVPSIEYTQARVRDMVKHQREAYKWQFGFLGCNIDSYLTGDGFGISGASTSNYRSALSATAFAATSAMISRGKLQASAGQEVTLGYTATEKTSMN